jgi:hypothetical protein
VKIHPPPTRATVGKQDAVDRFERFADRINIAAELAASSPPATYPEIAAARARRTSE